MAPIGGVRAGYLSAGKDAIPDSVIYQWTGGNFADPWPSDKGDVDMSLEGSLSEETLSDGSDGIEGDGTDDGGLADIPKVGNLDGTAWEFSMQTTTSEEDRIMGTNNNNTSGGSITADIIFNQGVNFNSDAGNFAMQIADENNDIIRFTPDSNLNLDDGSIHDISISFDDLANNNVTIFIDGSEVTTNVYQSGGPSQFNDFQEDFGFYGRSDGGTLEKHLNTALGKIRFHDTTLVSQTI